MTTPQPAGPSPAGSPGRERITDGLGTPAVVLGIIAVGIAWLGWPGALVGLVAVVVGFLGTRRAFNDPERTGGLALTGLVLGLVGLVWGLVVFLPSVFGTGAFGEGLTLDQCMQQAPSQQLQRICATQHLDEYRARFPGRQNI